jgi:hypothetical protein
MHICGHDMSLANQTVLALSSGCRICSISKTMGMAPARAMSPMLLMCTHDDFTASRKTGGNHTCPGNLEITGDLSISIEAGAAALTANAAALPLLPPLPPPLLTAGFPVPCRWPRLSPPVPGSFRGPASLASGGEMLAGLPANAANATSDHGAGMSSGSEMSPGQAAVGSGSVAGYQRGSWYDQ